MLQCIFALMQKRILLFYLCVLISGKSFSQTDSISQEKFKQRKIILTTGTSAIALTTLVYMNQAWYAQYNTGKFHFFNDNKEWLQMDKVGHVFFNYQTASLMMDAFEWAGIKRKQQLIYGGGFGFVFMTAIECMDGFSNGWGFSWGDELANAIGTGLAVGQKAIWNEQKIKLKFSYVPSGLANYNPSLLGKNAETQVLKDYNGQTYWLAFNPLAFTKTKLPYPKWLNLSLGYSAYGMLGGQDNNVVALDNNGNAIKFERERRFYFSFDVDLSQVKVKNKALKKIFTALNVLKFPFPALEFSKRGTKFYYIYY